MAGIATEESGIGRSLEVISSGQQPGGQSAEALAEWRSSGQVENGAPSTSPPYWDTDDDDCGPKPSELYGKYTWKIDNFSQINKRELRSNAFDVGGYKWYILIYPQGCDVCNHLSLFLCVANHDKLLPGWSHFAQFTIAVVNKDPKKSKYSDTLHRFWKKEHDWGWKKFMELSKVFDGFVDVDTLVIKAQVQVIRERADRPFRCLDCQYRRELVRVYLTNVEQICRRFVEERRGKLGKLLDDKGRWSSFCTFWLGIDQNARYRMSREKTDMILKVVVKHFFIEKEVTSTLVMDSLYSGLKALEGPTKSNKARLKLLDAEEMVVPIVRVEKDTFVLVDDILPLLERAVREPLPPKDEKGPQNRTKDGGCGEDFNKESIERDEQRLTELGRKTIEIFVLVHMFSKIEVAYQEAVALKRQEELIREEEEAWMAETEQRAKRGATEKEKKSKKKQGKQKGKNRKGKDKGRDKKKDVTVQDMLQPESFIDDEKDFFVDPVPVPEKPEGQDSFTDMSDSVDCVTDILRPGSDDRDASPVNWDTDTSEVHPPTEASNSEISGILSAQYGVRERKSLSIVDDSSSTCSTDSVPSMVMNGRYTGNSLPNKTKKSPIRGRTRRGKETWEVTSWANETHIQPSDGVADNRKLHHCELAELEPEFAAPKDQTKWVERARVKKEEQVVSPTRKLSIKDRTDVERSSSKDKTKLVPTSRGSIITRTKPSASQLKSDSKSGPSITRSKPSAFPLKSDLKSGPSITRITPSASQLKSYLKSGPITESVSVTKLPSNGPQQTDKTAPAVAAKLHEIPLLGKFNPQRVASLKPDEKPSQQQQVLAMSRPVSAPLNSRPITQSLSRSETGGSGRLGPEPSPYVPHSYRNAILGNSVSAPPSPSSEVNPSPSYSQPPATISISTPSYLPQSPDRGDRPSFSFGMLNHDVMQQMGSQWAERPQNNSRSLNCDPSSLLNDVQNLDIHKQHVGSSSRRSQHIDLAACTSGRQVQGLGDEFPHLDIINDLLDDEHGVVNPNPMFSSNGPQFLNRQFSYPGDIGMPNDMSSCRIERARSYHDGGFQSSCYGSSSGPFEAFTEMLPQAANQQQAFDGGMVMNHQWQMGASDLSFLGTRQQHVEGDGYPYHIPHYSDAPCTSNASSYSIYRPTNGH